MDYSLTKKAAEEQITAKLSHFFGVTPEEANYEQFYKAIAMITRDMLRQGRHEFEKRCEESGSKRVYYMCMEFLMGRSLKNTLYNLNLIPVMEEALKDFGIKLDKLYDCERGSRQRRSRPPCSVLSRRFGNRRISRNGLLHSLRIRYLQAEAR